MTESVNLDNNNLKMNNVSNDDEINGIMNVIEANKNLVAALKELITDNSNKQKYVNDFMRPILEAQKTIINTWLASDKTEEVSEDLMKKHQEATDPAKVLTKDVVEKYTKEKKYSSPFSFFGGSQKSSTKNRYTITQF